ncbi:hypothetical protein CR513_09526, partial [Mucuna pruriens]
MFSSRSTNTKDKLSREGSALILGQPFFMTARMKIDVHVGTFSMEFGDTSVKFSIFEALKHPAEDHSLFSIDAIDGLVEEYFQIGTTNDNLVDFESAEIESINREEAETVSNSQPKAGSDSNKKESQQLDRVGQPTPSTVKQDVSPQSNTELKSLPEHLKYAFLGDHQQFPRIIANNLNGEQDEKLLEVLRKHKKAIGWTLADLPGISPSIFMHKILLEKDARPIRQQQRRLNLTLLDVVKKEVTKLLTARIIYFISNSQWVSPVQVVPKKSEMIVVRNQQDEMVSTRIQNSWQVCIEYRKLNQETRKDHFPLSFIDEVLEKLAGKSHFCFLDGFSSYIQIHIAPMDQHKTTFTCPFETFAYTRMSFGLCNASDTF